MTWLDEKGRMPMQNAVLVGLSRQVGLAREMDVVANNIANLNTTGYKADGSTVRGISFHRRAGRPDRQPRELRARPRRLARYEPRADRAHRQFARCRRGRQRLPGGADAARRTLHPQRLDADQSDGPARHQRRQSGARRRRPDLAAADRPASVDQPRRHDQRARRQLESQFGARQASAGHVRQSAAAAERRRQHFQCDRPACSRNPRRRPASCKAPSRNRTCAAWSRCRA